MTNPRDLIKRLADSLHEAAGEVEGWGNYASSYFQEKHDLRGNVARIYAEAAEARAYLAQPKPQAPSKHELFGLLMQSGGANRVVSIEWLEPFALAVLARWGRPTPQPVSVSERLPRPEDCDADGRCWGWMNAEDGWNLYPPEHLPEWSFWLPHWALPVPTKAS